MYFLVKFMIIKKYFLKYFIDFLHTYTYHKTCYKLFGSFSTLFVVIHDF